MTKLPGDELWVYFMKEASHNFQVCFLGSLDLSFYSVLFCAQHLTYDIFSIKKVGPAESAVFINLNTMFAFFGAAIFLGESIVKHHIIGFKLIRIGIFTGSGAVEYVVRKKDNKQSHI